MRILLVSQMYPGPADPDLGVFVRGLEEQLVARGHDVERAVLDRRRRGKRKYLELARSTSETARRFHPDVVSAHFLVPTGLIATLDGRPGIELTGALPYDELPARIAAAHVVCQPSLIEPFGQATLEAMACGRSVVGTRIGGPPEFVPPDAGVLVDPVDEDALLAGMQAAAAMPRPNTAARSAAEAHDVRRQAERVEEILARAARGRRA